MTAALVTISTTIIGLLFLDWRFAVAGALATPIQLHTLRWYLGTSSPIYTAERRAEATRSQSLLDTIGGVETVHAFGLGPRQVEQVTATSSAALDISMKATHLRARFFGRLNLAEVIGLGAILLVGFKLVGDGSATVGQCTAAALYFHRLFDPINVTLFCVDALQSAFAVWLGWSGWRRCPCHRRLIVIRRASTGRSNSSTSATAMAIAASR